MLTQDNVWKSASSKYLCFSDPLRYTYLHHVYVYIRALVGTGATGAFAPINIEQWVHAPVLKRVIEFLSAVKVRKTLSSFK